MFRPRSVRQVGTKHTSITPSIEQIQAKKSKVDPIPSSDTVVDVQKPDEAEDALKSAVPICANPAVMSNAEREKVLREKLLKLRAIRDGVTNNVAPMVVVSEKAVNKAPAGEAPPEAVEVPQVEADEEESSQPDNSVHITCAISEQLGGRYRVMSTLGKGVFATVFRCLDVTLSNGQQNEVAVKVLRSGSSMEASFQSELAVLTTITTAHSASHYLVRCLDSFKHQDHYCIVTENMHVSLRHAMKSFGKGGRITMDKLAIFATQLTCALRSIHELGYIHLDIKPDNIVVNRAFNVAKLIDFGSTLSQEELHQRFNGTDNHLVARFYRPPEITLKYGDWTSKIDVWSLGVTLAEAASGSPLFYGANNSEVLFSLLTLLGPPPDKVARGSQLFHEYFHMRSSDGARVFLKQDAKDPKVVLNCRMPEKPASLRNRLFALLKLPVKSASKDYDSIYRLSNAFVDFLTKCLCFDPTRRLSASALSKESFVHSD